MNLKEEDDGRSLKIEYIDNIKIDNISFSYKDNINSRVIENFNFVFKKDDKILIKGLNGSGKTTLIKLLLGLYEPDIGEIYYNVRSLSDLSRESLRNNISVVSQHIFLFKGTILENILYNCCPNMTQDSLEEIISQYGLSSYLNGFDKGLFTMLTHGGTNISGGQKQLIAFLRAVVSKKNIMILDEPTSNMDNSLKEVVSEILLSHRLANILIIISHDNIFDSIDIQITL